MELKGKTVVVTGSTGRLGSAITLALARAGCRCLCHYNHNEESAFKLVEQIQSLGQDAIAAQADLSSADQIQRLFEKCADFGQVQILINSAAVFARQSLSETSFEKGREIMDVNFVAVVLASKYFAELVRSNFPDAEGPVAKIINMADVGGIRPWAKYVFYCASKAALINATKSLAKELAPAICVNAVAPGVVTWPEGFDEAAKKRQLSFIPAGRIGDVSEIASAVIFLLENDYITGQVLQVDGGRCI